MALFDRDAKHTCARDAPDLLWNALHAFFGFISPEDALFRFQIEFGMNKGGTQKHVAIDQPQQGVGVAAQARIVLFTVHADTADH